MFTSSIGVYAPSKVFFEEDVWKTYPSENDKFAGWAKRISELLIESFKIQYNLENFYIVRPANVYGPGDNFDKNNVIDFSFDVHQTNEHDEFHFEMWNKGWNKPKPLYMVWYDILNY